MKTKTKHAAEGGGHRGVIEDDAGREVYDSEAAYPGQGVFADAVEADTHAKAMLAALLGLEQAREEKGRELRMLFAEKAADMLQELGAGKAAAKMLREAAAAHKKANAERSAHLQRMAAAAKSVEVRPRWEPHKGPAAVTIIREPTAIDEDWSPETEAPALGSFDQRQLRLDMEAEPESAEVPEDPAPEPVAVLPKAPLKARPSARKMGKASTKMLRKRLYDGEGVIVQASTLIGLYSLEIQRPKPRIAVKSMLDDAMEDHTEAAALALAASALDRGFEPDIAPDTAAAAILSAVDGELMTASAEKMADACAECLDPCVLDYLIEFEQEQGEDAREGVIDAARRQLAEVRSR